MAKKMRNGLTQKQRKTQVRRVAEAIDIYEIRPNRPMRLNWKNYPDPADPVVNTKDPANHHTGQCPVVSVGGPS